MLVWTMVLENNNFGNDGTCDHSWLSIILKTHPRCVRKDLCIKCSSIRAIDWPLVLCYFITLICFYTIFKGYMLTYLLIIIHSIAIVFLCFWNWCRDVEFYWYWLQLLKCGCHDKNILPMENIFTSGHRTVTSAVCVTLKYAVDVKNRM